MTTARQNIERIDVPSAAVFWRDYVLPRRPVILKNVFEGEPIREVRTLEQALRELGGMRIEVREEYTTTFYEGEGFAMSESRYLSLQDYVEHVRASPRTRQLVVEHETSPELRKLYTRPAFLRPPYGAEFTFVANPGNYAHLHYDWEPTHNLLYQVFGTKRFMVIPSEHAHKINPVAHFSAMRVENFSESEKRAFLEYVGGWECVLEPGEALFMPMFVWHHIEYQDLSMSITTRFGENRYASWMIDALGGKLSLHRDCYVQNIGAKLTDEAEAARWFEPFMAQFDQRRAQIQGNAFDHYKGVQKIMRELYLEQCPEARKYESYQYWPIEGKADEVIRGLLKRMGVL